MLAHYSFDWANAGVGAVGLVLTVTAIIQATGAKRAAVEAREAIWKRESSFVVAEISWMTLELIGLIESERFDVACTRARDICSRIARDQARFRRFYSRDFNHLVDLERRFSEIAEQLSSTEISDVGRTVRSLSNQVYEANRILNGIYGRQQSGLDKEDE